MAFGKRKTMHHRSTPKKKKGVDRTQKGLLTRTINKSWMHHFIKGLKG